MRDFVGFCIFKYLSDRRRSDVSFIILNIFYVFESTLKMGNNSRAETSLGPVSKMIYYCLVQIDLQ